MWGISVFQFTVFSTYNRVLYMKTISEDLFENINRIDLLKVSAIASVNLTVFQYFYL